MIYTDTITIFIYCKKAEKEMWYKKVLKNVMWKRKTVKTVSSDGKLHVSEVVSITIPHRAGYKPYKEFLALDDKKDYWTIETGSNLSMAVLGECNKIIDDNYRLKDLKRDCTNVVTISAFADNTNRDYLKHWRIDGV